MSFSLVLPIVRGLNYSARDWAHLWNLVARLLCFHQHSWPVIGLRSWTKYLSTRLQVGQPCWSPLNSKTSLPFWKKLPTFFFWQITEKHKCFVAVKSPQNDSRYGRCHTYAVLAYKKIASTSVSPSNNESVASGTRQGMSGHRLPTLVSGLWQAFPQNVWYTTNQSFVMDDSYVLYIWQANQYTRHSDTIGGLPEPGQTQSYQIIKDGICTLSSTFAPYSKNMDPIEKELLEELHSR